MVKIIKAFSTVFEVLLLEFYDSTTGQINPKQSLIVQEAKTSTRTVVKAIKALVAFGILSVHKNYTKCVLYPTRYANSYEVMACTFKAIKRN